jgi:hypothetical protein
MGNLMSFPIVRTRRGRAAAAALIVAATALLLTPPAAARMTPEAKQVKRRLIALEARLDSERRTLRALAGGSSLLRAAAVAARSDLAGPAPEALHGGTWVGLLRLSEADRKLHSIAARRGVLRSGISALRARRRGLVAKLDRLAAEARRARPGLFASWSISGRLVTYSADWEAVALCESAGDWHINASHDGGLQFHPNTWIGFGGGEFARYAYQATKLQQIAVAERVLAIQGARAWPKCFTALPFGF